MLCVADLVLVVELVDSSKKGRVAQVVCNHDGRIKRLKVQNQDWTREEGRFGFEDEWNASSCILSSDLIHDEKKRKNIGVPGELKDGSFPNDSLRLT